MKTKFKGCGHKPLSSSMSASSTGRAGRPSSRDIVRHHKAANIKSLGYTNFATDRPGKVRIKGKAPQP